MARGIAIITIAVTRTPRKAAKSTGHPIIVLLKHHLLDVYAARARFLHVLQQTYDSLHVLFCGNKIRNIKHQPVRANGKKIIREIRHCDTFVGLRVVCHNLSKRLTTLAHHLYAIEIQNAVPSTVDNNVCVNTLAISGYHT